MSVRNCVFPWHWALVTVDGDVLPCSHGALAVGNLHQQSIEEIWNGPAIQGLRASILRGEVHELCRCGTCPFQTSDPAFPEAEAPLEIEEYFARTFDERWYLDMYPDAASAVKARHFVSGLEHYVRHGRADHRAYRLNSWQTPYDNAVLGLVEYTLGLTVIAAKPVDLILSVTTVCNLRCVMCPHGMDLVDRPRHMPVAVAEKLKSFLPTACRMIVSGLGEPTIAPAFWWILEHTRHREDLFIRVNSNGQLMTPERARRIVESGLTEISFSLDAATTGTYRKIRGGDFSRALQGIGVLLAARRECEGSELEICINMTLMKENLPEIPDFIRLAKHLGVDAVILTQLFTFGDRPDWQVPRGDWTFRYSEQMLERSAKETGRHLRRAQERSEELGMPIRYHCNVASYLKAEAAEPIEV